MNEYTPGPWISRPILGENFRAAIKARTAPGGIALTLRGLGEIEEDANARLIAAAPELLEALKAIDDLLKGDLPVTQEVKEIARPAIAKALGQQVSIGQE
jgi:hypothetical protein